MAESVIVYVHSYITIYLAKYLLENRYAIVKNVLVLYDRTSENDLHVLNGEKLNLIQSVGERFVTPRSFSSINSKLNSLIKDKVKGEYHLVVPHLYFDSLQILANNSGCKKVIYLEEGDMSYQSQQELDATYQDAGKFEKKTLVRNLYSLGKLKASHPFPSLKKDCEFVCFGNEAFPFVKQGKTIFNFKDVFRLSGNKSLDKYNGAAVLLMNKADLRYWDKKPEMYLQELERVLEQVKAEFGNTIFIKPHPAMYTKRVRVEELVKILISHGFSVDFVEEAVELILVNSEKVKVMTSPTSLIRYCVYAGVKPYFWSKKFLSEASNHFRVYKKFEDQLVVL